jgi:hypothetical protein
MMFSMQASVAQSTQEFCEKKPGGEFQLPQDEHVIRLWGVIGAAEGANPDALALQCFHYIAKPPYFAANSGRMTIDHAGNVFCRIETTR